MVIIWLEFFGLFFIIMYVIIFLLVNFLEMEVVICKNLWSESVVIKLKCVLILFKMFVEGLVMVKDFFLIFLFILWFSKVFRVIFEVLCFVFFMFCVFVEGNSFLFILVVIINVWFWLSVLNVSFILFFCMYLLRVLMGFLLMVE